MSAQPMSRGRSERVGARGKGGVQFLIVSVGHAWMYDSSMFSVFFPVLSRNETQMSMCAPHAISTCNRRTSSQSASLPRTRGGRVQCARSPKSERGPEKLTPTGESGIEERGPQYSCWLGLMLYSNSGALAPCMRIRAVACFWQQHTRCQNRASQQQMLRECRHSKR